MGGPADRGQQRRCLDELFGYNALNELTGATRGTLNSTHTEITANQSLTESWALDGMGNWFTFTQTGGAPRPLTRTGRPVR